MDNGWYYARITRCITIFIADFFYDLLLLRVSVRSISGRADQGRPLGPPRNYPRVFEMLLSPPPAVGSPRTFVGERARPSRRTEPRGKAKRPASSSLAERLGDRRTTRRSSGMRPAPVTRARAIPETGPSVVVRRSPTLRRIPRSSPPRPRLRLPARGRRPRGPTTASKEGIIAET